MAHWAVGTGGAARTPFRALSRARPNTRAGVTIIKPSNAGRPSLTIRFIPFLTHMADAALVDITVAFTVDSGVWLVEEHLRDVVTRGGRVRLLTGDYLASGATCPAVSG